MRSSSLCDDSNFFRQYVLLYSDEYPILQMGEMWDMSDKELESRQRKKRAEGRN